ncbi:MAG: zinc ribbon domain-containing protein [Dehalococcoidia bacterium]|nr:zinc ribbon domain-containing protein [Dehalococcoidia bacterium]
MPIYEYKCSACGSGFELLRPFSKSAEIVNCPKCGKPSKRRVSTFASVSKSSSGETTPIAGGGGGCGSCGSSNCGSCGG